MIPAHTHSPDAGSVIFLFDDGKRTRYGVSAYATGKRRRDSRKLLNVPKRVCRGGYAKICRSIPATPRTAMPIPTCEAGRPRPPLKKIGETGCGGSRLGVERKME